MKNLKNHAIKVLLVLPLLFLTLNGTAGAVTRINQDVTCYVANPVTEFPSQPGYSYVFGVTAASQLSIRGNYGSKPKIPYGTRVTFSTPVYIAGLGNKSSFTIRDTGDPNWRHTPYFVDVYFGAISKKQSCLNDFGTKKRNITY